MDAQTYLYGIERIETNIVLLQEELVTLFSLATSMTAPTDKEPGSSSGVSDPVGNFGTKLAYRDDRIKGEIDELFRERDERVAAILAVTDVTARKVLYRHYVNRMKFKDIAVELGYSQQSISEYRKKGEAEVQKSVQDRTSPY